VPLTVIFSSSSSCRYVLLLYENQYRRMR
jgi:hypothetical protein